MLVSCNYVPNQNWPLLMLDLGQLVGVSAPVEASHHLCWACHLTRGTGHIPRPTTTCLGLVGLHEILIKSTAQNKASWPCGKSAGSGSGWACELDEVGFQGITRVGQTAWLIESRHLAPACSCQLVWGEGSTKAQLCLTVLPSWRKLP